MKLRSQVKKPPEFAICKNNYFPFPYLLFMEKQTPCRLQPDLDFDLVRKQNPCEYQNVK